MSYDFRLNAEAPFTVYNVGPEAEPLVVIDGMMAEPNRLVDFAARDCTYGPAGAAYPGLRSPIPEVYMLNVHGALKPLLQSVFGIPVEQPMSLAASFAMVTRSGREMKHNQRVPHIDRTGDHDLAFVHYLCGPEFGGTSFFRHKQTGFQRLNAEREIIHDETLAKELQSQILPATFPDENHPLYDRMAKVDAAFDRLVVYRASMLHSPNIHVDDKFSPDPRTGRLTVTAFLFAI
ncbi:DUF6445 family protein [Brevundimonas sp.]|uniref:DUF6445 family protein n=1 Tax=Brevundimonas sp. TaxID=1871086 RepID=UPI0035683BAF